MSDTLVETAPSDFSVNLLETNTGEVSNDSESTTFENQGITNGHERITTVKDNDPLEESVEDICTTVVDTSSCLPASTPALEVHDELSPAEMLSSSPQPAIVQEDILHNTADWVEELIPSETDVVATDSYLHTNHHNSSNSVILGEEKKSKKAIGGNVATAKPNSKNNGKTRTRSSSREDIPAVTRVRQRSRASADRTSSSRNGTAGSVTNGRGSKGRLLPDIRASKSDTTSTPSLFEPNSSLEAGVENETSTTDVDVASHTGSKKELKKSSSLIPSKHTMRPQGSRSYHRAMHRLHVRNSLLLETAYGRAATAILFSPEAAAEEELLRRSMVLDAQRSRLKGSRSSSRPHPRSNVANKVSHHSGGVSMSTVLATGSGSGSGKSSREIMAIGESSLFDHPNGSAVFAAGSYTGLSGDEYGFSPSSSFNPIGQEEGTMKHDDLEGEEGSHHSEESSLNLSEIVGTTGTSKRDLGFAQYIVDSAEESQRLRESTQPFRPFSPLAFVSLSSPPFSPVDRPVSPFERETNELTGSQKVAAEIIRKARVQVSANARFQERKISYSEIRLLSSPFAKKLLRDPSPDDSPSRKSLVLRKSTELPPPFVLSAGPLNTRDSSPYRNHKDGSRAQHNRSQQLQRGNHDQQLEKLLYEQITSSNHNSPNKKKLSTTLTPLKNHNRSHHSSSNSEMMASLVSEPVAVPSQMSVSHQDSSSAADAHEPSTVTSTITMVAAETATPGVSKTSKIVYLDDDDSVLVTGVAFAAMDILAYTDGNENAELTTTDVAACTEEGNSAVSVH